MKLKGGNVIAKMHKIGSPHWKYSELLFEKKQLIPMLKQLLEDAY